MTDKNDFLNNNNYSQGSEENRHNYLQNEPQRSPESPNPQTTPGSNPPGYNPGQNPGPPGNDNNSDQNQKQLQNIQQLGQNELPASKSDLHVITIVGQIEGHLVLPPKNKTTKYEHIIPQLVAVEENTDIKGLLVILNTVGGDIEAGLAISEMLSSMHKPTVSVVLGGGHSIGVPVATSTDYSFIVESASMTIHPIRLTGKIIGVPQTYEYLDKMQDRVISFVTTHSGINEDHFRELMFQTGNLVRDVGTVLIGEDAVRHNIINQVGGLYPALSKLRELISGQ